MRVALWGMLAVVVVLLAATPVEADDAPGGTIPAGRVVYLPTVSREAAAEPEQRACPTMSTRTYDLIPVDGPPADHPDSLHGDLNLALRGYAATDAALHIVNINGEADPHAPQMPGIFADRRTPVFSSAHRVYEWDWSCGEHGCRSPNLTPRPVTLLGLQTQPDEALSFPSRGPEIYAGGYKVLVLYAEENRITLGYTRHDTVASGYAVHLENMCVDPNLLALYRQANTAGRGELPALRDGEVLGAAHGDEVLVAVRDRGTFMDPRSRKDWWKGR